jgi:hypothetical protein
MFNLPIELQRRIYEYDPTYKTIMNNIINNDIPLYILKNHILYPYLMDLFEDIRYDFDNAMYYYNDENGEAQVSYIDDDITKLKDNFTTDGDALLYQGSDISYLLDPYMTDYEFSDEEDLQFFIDIEY